MSIFGEVKPPTSQGPCVFGQGYCSPNVNNVSQTFNKNLTENLKTTMVKKATTVGAVMSNSQVIDFSGSKFINCAGVTFDGISQKAVMTFDFSMIAQDIDKSSYDAMMASAIDTALTATTESVKGSFSSGNAANTLNLIQSSTENINKLATSFKYEDFMNVMSTMNNKQYQGFAGMEIDGGGKPCSISNLDQDVVMTSAVSIASKRISEEFTKIFQENDTSSTGDFDTTTTSTGLFQDIGGSFESIGNIFSKPMQWLLLIVLVVTLGGIITAMYRRRRAIPRQKIKVNQ
jgi:hypothetical protein